MSDQPATLAIDKIQVREGHNVRDADEELKSSIQALGILTPLAVEQDGDNVYLVAGHRRLAGARAAGLDEVPVTWQAEANGYTVQARRHAVAAAENISRRNLNPVQEAVAIKRLLDSGMTEDGVRDTLGVSAQFVANRKLILDTDEAWWPRIAAGYVNHAELVFLASIYAVSKPLGVALLAYNTKTKAEIKQGADPLACRIDGWATRNAAHEANGLWPLGSREPAKNYIAPLKLAKVAPDAAKKIAKLATKQYGYTEEWSPTWTEQDVDRFRAGGVLWEDPEDTGKGADSWQRGNAARVVTDTELFRQVLIEKIEAAAIPKAQGKQTSSGSGKDAGDDAEKSAEKKLKEKRAGFRDEVKALQVEARGLNLDLGTGLIKGLAKVKLTGEALDVILPAGFARERMDDYSTGSATSYTYRELAMAGMRYCHADYSRTEKVGKRQTEKLVYDDGKAAQERLVKWIGAAKSAEERLGRHLVAVCLAHLSIEEAIPTQSERSRFYGRGDRKQLDTAIRKLTKGMVPRGLEQTRKRLQAAEKSYKATLSNSR